MKNYILIVCLCCVSMVCAQTKIEIPLWAEKGGTAEMEKPLSCVRVVDMEAWR